MYHSRLCAVIVSVCCRSESKEGGLLVEGSNGVVKRLKILLDHLVKLRGALLLLGCIFLELRARLLMPCPRFKWCLLQEQLFKIVGSIEVGFLARGNEDRRDQLVLERFKIKDLEEGVASEVAEAVGTDALLDTLCEEVLDGVDGFFLDPWLCEGVLRGGVLDFLA